MYNKAIISCWRRLYVGLRKGWRSAGRICDNFAESIGGVVRFVLKDMAIVEIYLTGENITSVSAGP